MTNFIAFNFSDNDFHGPLREAIQYVINKQDDDVTPAHFRLFILRGMTAFDALRRVDNWYAAQPWRDLTEYFNKLLTVKYVDKLSDLPVTFAGYVYDVHTKDLFYYEG